MPISARWFDLPDIRIGVYVCGCGGNISSVVDVAAVCRRVMSLEGVVVARSSEFMCAEGGRNLIAKDIMEASLNRVVVGACSPRFLEGVFRRTLEAAGLNGYLLEMANIREQCSWVTEESQYATSKAVSLVKGAVGRVRWNQPLEDRRARVNPSVLVVGGGVAGTEAATRLAEAGVKVFLVERQPSIGGNAARLHRVFPSLECATCVLMPRMSLVGNHPNIELLTCSKVIHVRGSVGDLEVRIRVEPRGVDPGRCTGCGDCERVCPVSLPDPSNEGLSSRKAIHKPLAHAIPSAHAVDRRGLAPCRSACPAGCNVPAYVALIAAGRFDEALEVIERDVPFPGICGRVCQRPCEERCRAEGGAVAIGALKRAVADLSAEKPRKLIPARVGNEVGERIAVVGAGPSGLTAARDLVLMGHSVTLFDQLPLAGGMLAAGIPEYRLPRKLVTLEIARVLEHGIDFRPNVKLGRDISLRELFLQGYRAVLIAVGTQRSRTLNVEGSTLEGIVDALTFLRRTSLGEASPTGERVLVVGGGRVALDVARTAIRLGATDVQVACLERAGEMRVSDQDLEVALEEGVQINNEWGVVRFLPDPQKPRRLGRVELARVVPGSASRRSPVPIYVESSSYLMERDNVIVAIGEEADLSFLEEEGVSLQRNGFLTVNPLTMACPVEGVFACGDVVTGPSSVVEAVASGHRAARAIDAFLRGRLHALQPPPLQPEAAETPHWPRGHLGAGRRRVTQRMLSPAERKAGFGEVVACLAPEEAVEEASRCMNCGGCSGCGACEAACTAGAIDLGNTGKEITVRVGAVIIATGHEMLDPTALARWGYGSYANVFTSMEFERMLSPDGPTGGRITLPDGRTPEAVAVVHCVGSRDVNYKPYCSRVCCAAALKFAHAVRESTRARVYEFYVDMRVSGRRQEEFYQRVQDEGVRFIRGKVAEVLERDGKLLVRAEDTLLGLCREVPVDMVILNTALVSRRDSRSVAGLFGIQQDSDGFFVEAHSKLEPIRAPVEGVYLAGTCVGPCDIAESIAQGGAAAAAALARIDAGYITVSAVTAYSLQERCSGCRTCTRVCPHSAITFDEVTGTASYDDGLCQGCGICAAGCPSGAAGLRHHERVQMMALVEGVLQP